MYYGTTGTGNFTITFGMPQMAPCACGQPAKWRTQEGELLCDRCDALRSAPLWIAAAFRAVTREQRSRLYRQLSTIFHPDAGGDERLMQALNAVKERFP